MDEQADDTAPRSGGVRSAFLTRVRDAVSSTAEGDALRRSGQSLVASAIERAVLVAVEHLIRSAPSDALERMVADIDAELAERAAAQTAVNAAHPEDGSIPAETVSPTEEIAISAAGDPEPEDPSSSSISSGSEQSEGSTGGSEAAPETPASESAVPGAAGPAADAESLL